MSRSTGAGTVRGDAAAVSAFFAALFIGVGVHLPFFPVFLAERGLGPDEIGIVVAAPLVARAALLPLLGAAADRFGSLTRAIVVYATLTFGLFWLVGLASGFVALLVAYIAVAVVWNAQVPLADAVAMRLARTAGANYGRMRACGSAAFIVASFAAGFVVEERGGGAVFWMLVASFGLTLGAAIGLERRKVEAPAPTRQPFWGGALAALRPALPLVLACALVQGSHALLYGFGSIGWQKAGFSGAGIGALWAVGVTAEIALFSLPGRIVGRVPPAGLAAIGALAALVRWLGLALDPGYAVVLGLQALHGLSFGATHLALVRHIAERATPGRQGTTQALGATFIAAFLAAGSTVSGPLYGALGLAAFAVMAIPAAAALAIAAVVLLRAGR